jgi:hypothetical protein
MSGRRFSLINKKPVLPLTTTTSLEDITHVINTGGSKREGALYRNSTTSKLVIASGPLAGDVWQDSDGTTLHTPV